jgi:hypothetical protein
VDHSLTAFLASLGILASVVAGVELGRRIGMRRAARSSAADTNDVPGRGAVDGAVFGLMGLLLAFTFSGAIDRWDARRELAVNEANAIGTAWLRVDLLPEAAQPPIRELFRGYLDARLETYANVDDMPAAEAANRRAFGFHERIWDQATAACRDTTQSMPTMLLLPALNAMFDEATTRIAATKAHPPAVIYALLALLVMASALVAGHGMAPGGSRSWIHVFAFASALAATVYVVIDMEYPRLGFIRIDAIDHLLIELRQSMN